MNRKILVFVTLLAAILIGYRPAWSQVETGSINGTVTDSTGAVIPGATVTAKNVGTSATRTAQTETNGAYLLQELPPGIYEVTASSGNFAPFTARVEVTVGGKATLDAQLSVSGKTTTVEVVGEGGAVVNTQSQELSQLVDSTQMAQLPSLNRNPYDFVALSGNVSNGDETSNGGTPNPNMSVGQNLTGYGVGYSINGQRPTGTEILLDGVENVGVFSDVAGQPVPADSVQEFSIITNNFSEEYGRASGGIVNLDTKSGTNDIHGAAFDYNRLSAYTANTFGNEINDLPKGSYVRNQFGYDLGGPFIKNKLFGFFSEEFVRVRSNAIETEEILDPSFVSLLPSNVQSFFSTFGTGAQPVSGAVTTAGQLVNAGTFGTNPITMANNPFPSIDGTTAVASTQPIFDVVNFRAPFDAGGGVPQNEYNIVGRVDYNLSDKTQMFFRLARYRETDFNGATFYSPYPQFDVGDIDFDDSALYSISHMFSSTLLSNTKFSFARYNTGSSFDTALTQTPNLYFTTSSYASPIDPTNSNIIQLPGLENVAEGTGGLPFGGPQNTFQIEQDLAWTKGRHTFHFGGQFTYIQLNVAYGAYFQANEVLGSDVGPSLTNLVDASGLMSDGAFAAPLLQFQARVNAEGALPCATDNFGNEIETPSCMVTPPLPAADPARSYRYKDWALYAGDSFKATRRLTLNYALRYEHFGVQHNNHQDLDSNFYLGAGTYPEDVRDGQVELTTQSPIGQFWKPRWGTFAPRVGFAYDIFGDGKSSIRGGFGISYERNFGNVTYNASFNPPASAVVSSNCGSNGAGEIVSCGQFVTNNDLGPLGQPGPAAPLTPSELRFDGDNINVAQTQFWSLAVERQLAPSTLVSISYSGAHGVHLYDLNNINMIAGGQFYLGDPLVTTFFDPTAPTSPQCPYTDPGATAALTAVQQMNGDVVNACYTRPNSQYAAINERGSFGSSSYNGLNVHFQTNDIHHTGLAIVSNYTWSHSLDDLSATFSDDLTQGSLGYTSFTNPKLDWGSSDFDERHRITIAPVWQTPWYKSGSGVLPEVLGGWTVSGIFTAHTGIPFSIYNLNNLVNDYTIPRLIPLTPVTQFHTGTPVLQAGEGNTFVGLVTPDPNNEVLDPALGISDFGPFPSDMTRRNAFRGPGDWNTDLAIGKKFRLTERFGLEFRAEAFNAFNHHNFYVDGSDNYITGSTGIPVIEEKGGLGSAALGGNHDERRFGQFSLRLSF